MGRAFCVCPLDLSYLLAFLSSISRALIRLAEQPIGVISLTNRPHVRFSILNWPKSRLAN